MIKIQNGVIKNISALCPESQRYLEKLENKLKLSKGNDSFYLGFFYQYSKDNNSTWDSIKYKLHPKKEEFKNLFPSIKKIHESERQKKTVSELVELIKTDILNKLIAFEKEHSNKAYRNHKLLAWLAYIAKRVSGLLIFGVTTITIVAVAAAATFGIGAFAPTAASIVKLISANTPLVAAVILATLSLTGISHVISRYLLKKRNEESPTADAAQENCEDITNILEKGKHMKIDRTFTNTNGLGTLATSVPSAPYSPHYSNNGPANIESDDIKNAFVSNTL